MARSRRRNGRCEFATLLFCQRSVSWRTVLLHLFHQEFHRRLSIKTLGDIAFQGFALMIHGPPQVVHLAVDFHEHVAQMPLQVEMGSHAADAISLDFGREHRTKSISPEADGLVADIDAAFV